MKKESNKWRLLKLMFAFPLACLAMVSFAETKPSAATENPEELFHMPYSGRIRVEFGKKMTDPINGRKRTHKGIDVIVANDTVRSPYSGVVKFSRDARDGYGNKLIIAHRNGLETMYAHLAKPLVKEGDTVHGGEAIALAGSTGHSTGKHLHLECRVNGELVDPASALPLSGQQ